MTLRVFITGGTFDKEYDEIHGRLDFGDTHLPEMLRRGRCQLDLELRTLMMVDSLEMTDGDRETIARNCVRSRRTASSSPTEPTPWWTRRASWRRPSGRPAAGGPDKTIVLTGAMIPYAFGSSDGLFNLGSALSFAQVLPPGVYVAMNGRCFPWDNVRKNRETGRFETLV
jgi:L-asparaginase